MIEGLIKLYKPKKCEKCAVCRKLKDKLQCGVDIKLTAHNDNTTEKIEMWKNCPIEWDE